MDYPIVGQEHIILLKKYGITSNDVVEHLDMYPERTPLQQSFGLIFPKLAILDTAYYALINRCLEDCNSSFSGRGRLDEKYSETTLERMNMLVEIVSDIRTLIRDTYSKDHDLENLVICKGGVLSEQFLNESSNPITTKFKKEVSVVPLIEE